MKLRSIITTLAAVVCASCAEDHETTSAFRRGTLTNSTRRPSKRECVVFLIEKQYEDHRHSDEPIECELQGEDLKGRKSKTVRVKNLSTSWALKHNIISGISTLFAPATAVIDDVKDELIIPAGTTVTLGRRNNDNYAQTATASLDPTNPYGSRRLVTGVRTVLVIRIQAKDASTTASEAELANSIFGNRGDTSNLKSGYNQCSDGKLQFQPLTTNALVGTDGVYTVKIPNTSVRGRDDSNVVSAALSQVKSDLKVFPESIADHVMVCIPPGTSGDWIAYANINGWRSVYNDRWCEYYSGQMHEFGHNLNLGHATEGGSEYADQSGLMGYSYRQNDGPYMCFNGPNTYQQSWFSSFHVDLPNGSNYYWTGNLVGFAEKPSAVPQSDWMIIRIRGSRGTDYYVHFNRQIGMNSGTKEGGNEVLVASRDSGTGYAKSSLLAKLGSSDSYSVSKFNGSSSSLRILVLSINTRTTPARAVVSIQFGPPPAPTRAPTRSPTSQPTRSPTSPPTRSPTQSPTLPPTRSPTLSPTGQPTSSPTSLPTRSPTMAPTGQPTSSPTSQPTRSPTLAPTSQPTHSPTLSPTGQPTSSPTLAPTAQPTPSPTHTPSSAPSFLPTESIVPTLGPSSVPTTSSEPSSPPSESLVPTIDPSSVPTTSSAPSFDPTTSSVPTTSSAPSFNPTTSSVPTLQPSIVPSISPTLDPSMMPSSAPVSPAPVVPSPSVVPSNWPSRVPSASPTKAPTSPPTRAPTRAPTKRPPTKTPTRAPTSAPTKTPTSEPTKTPTSAPTSVPTKATSRVPTRKPTSKAPTRKPTLPKL